MSFKMHTKSSRDENTCHNGCIQQQQHCCIYKLVYTYICMYILDESMHCWREGAIQPVISWWISRPQYESCSTRIQNHVHVWSNNVVE